MEIAASMFICARNCNRVVLGAFIASGLLTASARAQSNDPDSSGAFQQIRVQAAWNKTKGDCTKVIIAVIGNGVDVNHPDLKRNIMANPGERFDGLDNDNNGEIDDVYGWNFAGSNNNPQPDTNDASGVPWHETYVAGIIGAVGNNGLGTTGVCQRARIFPIKKVFADDSNPDAANQAAAAINYAVDFQRRESARERHYVPMVINGSWVMDIGWANASPMLGQAINNASSAGIAMVFAAGNFHRSNDDQSTAVFPATWSISNANVISVGAVDANDHLSSVSNYGNSVLITAPAVNIVSTMPGGGYAFDVAGNPGFTSFATPQVTAAIAMYWSLHPTVPFSVVKSALLNSADHINGLPVLNGNRLNVGQMINAY